MGDDKGKTSREDGYRPLNEGYRPIGNRGYKPTSGSAAGGSLPKGGSGQSSGQGSGGGAEKN